LDLAKPSSFELSPILRDYRSSNLAASERVWEVAKLEVSFKFPDFMGLTSFMCLERRVYWLVILASLLSLFSSLLKFSWDFGRR